MHIKSVYRGAHISAFKAREVARAIQGLPVGKALEILAFTPRKAAGLVEKTLKSAIANAENNANLKAESLVVHEAVIGEGATLKRFQPKARGSAGPIRKRTSHIRIILTDEVGSDSVPSTGGQGARRSRKPGAQKVGGRRRGGATVSPTPDSNQE